MAQSAEAYFATIQADLPKGPAWPREQDGILDSFLHALAEELSELEVRSDRLQEEADPRTTFELLPDWERVLGLPDPCLGPNPDLTRRREAVPEKENAEGSSNLAVYEAITVAMGYEATFREYRPFRCGRSKCAATHTLGPSDQAHKIRVSIAGPRKIKFRCGLGRCGIDPLTKTIGGEDLVCRLRREMPDHVQKLFVVQE